jgi:RNA recognition motif-containing protein
MGKIYVSNLPEGISEEELGLIFGTVARPRSIKILRGQRTCAFVEFEDIGKAREAASKLDGRSLYGGLSELRVELAYDRNRRVVVSGIPSDASAEEVREFFGYYGLIENVEAKDSSAFFLDFKTLSDAARLLQLNGRIRLREDHPPITIEQLGRKEQGDSSDRCIFLYNLPQSTTEAVLTERFSPYGKILSSGVLSGGKGFVNYDRTLSALKAIRHMDGKKVGNKRIRVALKSMKKRRTG